MEDEEDRTRRAKALRAALDEARYLINEVELCNLRDLEVLPDKIARRLERLDRAVRRNDALAPREPGEALDRLYQIDEAVCRERQPWWFDFEPVDGEPDDGAAS